MYTHSVEKRFIFIVCAALLVLIAPLFTLFFYLSAERVLHERADRIKLTMSANAQALGKPLWDFDIESARKIAATIASDDGVLSVKVTDSSGEISVSIPENNIYRNVASRTVSQPVGFMSTDGYRLVGNLEIRVADGGFLSTIDLREISFLGIFAFAVLIVFAAALIANRVTVIRPLLRLTDAIAATRHLGSRHKVDWQSKDEMGILADKFNEMQIELEREENELKAAHAFAQTIYNQTPAMLYSIDSAENISAVSDYWLVATGYDRGNVIGRPFTDFVVNISHDAYHNRAKPITTGVATPGVTVKFKCANGDVIDILIRETATQSDSGQLDSLAVMTDVTELKDAETRNHLQAMTDHLTGMLNRQGFEAILDDKIAEVNRNHEDLACLFIDLDRFKWINDNLGHAAGDSVLQQVAKRMQTLLRPNDVLARLGGDEFAILIPAINAEVAAREIAEVITGMFSQPFKLENTDATLSASIGIAVYPLHASSAAELLQKSDMAMYARKRSGKNGMEVFNGTIANAARIRAEMERDIENALENDWFDAWLQPIVSLETGEMVGVEALMRLNHPQKGILPPAEIIAIAEEMGEISAIGDVIFEKAVRHLAKLHASENMDKIHLGVNFSPLQLKSGLPEKMMEALMKWGIHPSRMVVEITEAVLMQSNPEVIQVLETLKHAGMKIALDDFGTGFSSLSYLHRFPVDVIKIDKSFVSSLSRESAESRNKSYLLIEGINTIAHQMGCIVIAEGVETESQRDILREMGVEKGQGYLFAKPMKWIDIGPFNNNQNNTRPAGCTGQRDPYMSLLGL